MLSPFAIKRLNTLGTKAKRASRDNIRTFFREEVPALVLSAGNLVIFPKDLVDAPWITIFNYHNSILPRHKGVNAEAWTIFEGDKLAGITWHKVERGVDSGRILVQAKFPLPDNITSGELLKIQASVAVRALDDKLDALLTGEYELMEQERTPGSTHKKDERPNDGRLSPDWDPDKIWRFLRAYDYGATKNLGVPTINIGGQAYAFRGYEKKSPSVKAVPNFPKAFILDNIILRDLYPIEQIRA